MAEPTRDSVGEQPDLEGKDSARLDKLQQVADELTGKSGDETPQSDQQGKSGVLDAESEVTVSYDGVPRKVRVQDLVQAHAQRSQLERTRQELEQERERHQGLKALDQLVQNLNPQQQQRFKQLLSDPSLLESNGAEDEDDDVLDEIDQINSGKSRSRSKPAPVDPEYQQLKETVQTMARIMGQDLQQRQQQTLGQKVDEALASFPVFEGEDGQHARKFARGSILAQLQTNPNASLDVLARDHARHFQDLAEHYRKSAVAEAGFETPPQTPAGGKPPTGADLETGRLRNHLLGSPWAKGIR